MSRSRVVTEAIRIAQQQLPMAHSKRRQIHEQVRKAIDKSMPAAFLGHREAFVRKATAAVMHELFKV